MTEVPPPQNQPRRGWGMMAFGWFLALILMTAIFNGFLESRHNPNRLSALSAQEGDSLILRANSNGQYFAEGYINGTKTMFLLDTGATSVAMSPEVAERAGLTPGKQITVSTAAGTAIANNTRIRRLQLGHLIFSDLHAVIIPGGNDVVLLGMNALGELEMTQQDGKIILQKPSI